MIKTILFTAYPDHAAVAAALDAGAHGAMIKDVDRKLREHGLTRREYEIPRLSGEAIGPARPENRVNRSTCRP
ncbi:hypothetical protein [Nocardia terpenica]|uniref:hypothetical protein n=1 Tax=Nocardia terpenica TaxID=455432 RepID=UPI0015814935|nr:hypothetical protein [Nocardia terpenica]